MHPLPGSAAVRGACVLRSVFVSQLGKGGSWEFKRHRGTQLGVGNVGALAPRIAWELGGRVGAPKKNLLECEEQDSTLCLPANDCDVLSPQSTLGAKISHTPNCSF